MQSWTEPAHAVETGSVNPPLNFAMVSPGIYRSGYPKVENHSFLKLLKLQTLIYLCPEDCNEDNISFCKENGIQIMQFGIQGNKEPFVDIPEPVCVHFHANFLEAKFQNDPYVLTMQTLSLIATIR